VDIALPAGPGPRPQGEFRRPERRYGALQGRGSVKEIGFIRTKNIATLRICLEHEFFGDPVRTVAAGHKKSRPRSIAPAYIETLFSVQRERKVLDRPDASAHRHFLLAPRIERRRKASI